MPEVSSSTREVARRIGVSDTAIHKAGRAGRIGREPDGRWDIDKIRRRLVETADPGQEADCSNYDALMEARDSDPIRQDPRGRGAGPEIPTKRNRHVQHSVSRAPDAPRSRIECVINRLKNSRRVATRYDQTADSFLGFATLSSIRLWIRLVHAA